jgi:NAD(P)-dependent dehydrogenase (short-subunit alcohol dehydrogenase family)
MVERLAGKVALVSGGAGKGIGSAVCTRLAEEGAAVMIADIDDDGGRVLAARLCDRGLTAAFVHADATSYDDQVGAVAATVAEFGRLDVFNAHGIGRYTRDYLSNLSATDWDSGIQAVLGSAFYGVRAALPPMLANPGGSIILTSSAAGFGSQRGTAIYSVGKSAVMTLAQCVANEYGVHNIRCNAIAPGITGPSAATAATRTAYATVEAFTAQHALKRVIDVNEVADLVVFLASDESSAITGVVIPIDAGFSAGKGDFHGRPQYGEID